MDYQQVLKIRLEAIEKELGYQQNLLAESQNETVFSRKDRKGDYVYFKRSCSNDPGSGVSEPSEIYLGKNYDEAYRIAAQMLAQKRYDQLISEKKLIRKLLAFKEQESAADQYLKKHPGIGKLFADNNVKSESLADWKNQAYPRNMNHPENLKYTTVVPGLLVRSKAEADILSRLEYYSIPYHYDEVIDTPGDKLAMDFICRNIITGDYWYWDHRGLLDKCDYIRKTLYCDEQYYQAGIFPWINLIITSETKDHPLNIQWVDHLIRFYLM